MLFNSVDFLYFILLVLPLFYLVNYRYRNYILLVSSYFFYMCWNYSYVVLILFTTATSYLAAIGIGNSINALRRKIYLYASVISSLAILFVFKYYNFFVTTVNSSTGQDFNLLNYLLPVGISFYTFETLSYTIDVYHNKLKVERNFSTYALFISFFPKLVAGPIERSENLLPQFHERLLLKYDNIIIGAKYVIIGFFMKLVIADRLSLYVNSVYNNAEQHHGLTFWIATICFSFQILGDFAGYSAIAKGVAKWFDIDLMLNFRRPYMALTFSDFWRRWHISLSSWFRNYVYIPLGGNRGSQPKKYLNIMATFLLSGLWHGANFTFVVWGALHGTYLILEDFITGKKSTNSVKPPFYFRLPKQLLVFTAVSFAWIFFRANTLQDAVYIISHLFTIDNDIFIDFKTLFYGFTGIATLLCLDLYSEKKGDNNVLQNSVITLPVTILFCILTVAILYTGVFNGGQFIYFQF